MVRVGRVELPFSVWKTDIITAIRHPLVGTYVKASFCRAAKASAYDYVPPLKILYSRFAPWSKILVNRKNHNQQG